MSTQPVTELQTPAELQEPRKRKNPNNLAERFLQKQAGKSMSLDQLQASFRGHVKKVSAANERRAKYQGQSQNRPQAKGKN